MRFGTSSIDITPDEDVPLLGYDFRQEFLRPGNAGVRDPLFVQALALDAEDGNGPALIISMDLCIISVRFARYLRQEVAKVCSLAAERVMISCSHTHSGPWLDESGISEDVAAVLPNVQGDAALNARQRYTSALPSKVCEAAVLACGLFTSADCFYREAPLGLGYNRRVPQADGSVKQCWNPLEYPDLKPLPQADPSLGVLTLVQRGSGQRYSLWCHGTHPVTLGKTSQVVSADWPGAVRAQLKAMGIDSQFLLGACGDTHPWHATQGQSEAVDEVGRAASSLIALAAGSGGACAADALSIAAETRTIGGREIDLMAWNICGLRLLTSPTELFAPLACDLRQRVPGPLMVVTNTNGWTGYWPNRAAYAEGGYEIDAARAMGRSEGDSELLIDVLAELAAKVS